MNENIEELEFTIFDTETTGLNPACGDRIVELAGLKVRGEEIISQFDTLVNPECAISPGAYAVNKISPEMLAAAPSMAKVMPYFLDYIQGSCLCGYNVEFDLGFLNSELKLLGRPALSNFVMIDALIMARKLLPGLDRYPLWFVAQKLEVKLTQAHRALADVEMTWQVFSKLKIIAAQKGITTFTDFSNLFAFKPRITNNP